MRDMYYLDSNNIPEWTKKINGPCPVCKRDSIQHLVAEDAPKRMHREKVLGLFFRVSYQCCRERCKGLYFYGAFVPYRDQTNLMFSDRDYE